MGQSRYVTIMFIPDGAEDRSGFRIRQWLLKVIVGSIAFMLAGILLFFAFYGKVLTRAALADSLEKENERLLRYHYKVKLLEENLIEAREVVSRLTGLAGIDYVFPEFPDDSTFFEALERQRTAILERDGFDDLTMPSGLPAQGFISQDFELEDGSRYHPGIDIACPVGTPVLATAIGRVVFAEYDSTYGNMIVIRHNDSVTSVYGHNRELLVEVDDMVQPASRIALSGNTGVSTAPHLHYELRINNRYINPLEPYQDEKEQ